MVMEIIHLNKQTKQSCDHCCVALGFFDGFHIGHMSLLHKVVQLSNHTGYKKALMTFDQNPKAILKKQNYACLMTLQDKIEMLEKMDFDYLFIIDFNQDVASLLPEEFIEQYILKYHMKEIVCGYDFHFGKQQQGNYETLIQAEKNQYHVHVIDKVVYQDQKISSTYIKQLLTNGDLALANDFLNRFYSIKGTVIHGRQNGRKIGFPTANVDYAPYFILKKGVYAVKAIYQGKQYMAMANIGYNPTFKALRKLSLEVHIFDFDEMIYDKMLEIVFYKRIRDEKKFLEVKELIKQLEADKKEIKEYFKAFI